MASTEYINDLSTIWKIAENSSDEAWQKMTMGNFTADEYAQYLNDAGYNVVRSPNGSILSISKRITETIPDTIAGAAAEATNSNLQTGTAAPENTATFNQLGNTSLDTTTSTVIANVGASVYKTGQLTTGVPLTVSQITAPLLAVGTGIALGKAIDSTLYNIGNALDLNPPASLDPSTWAQIVSEDDSSGIKVAKTAFNMILGLDPNTNKTTAYVDENVLAYMSRYLIDNDYLASSYATKETTIDNFTVPAGLPITTGYAERYVMPNNSILLKDGTVATYENNRLWQGSSSANVNLPCEYRMTAIKINDSYQIIIASNNSDLYNLDSIPRLFYDTWYISDAVNIMQCAKYNNVISGYNRNLTTTIIPDNYLEYDSQFSESQAAIVGYSLFYGNISAPINGVNTASGATVPNIDNGLSQDEMLSKLKELYPELWQNRVENSVVQPDGTVKTYVYVPIQLPNEGVNENAGSSTETQGNYEIDPTTATDTQIATLIKLITNTLTDPTGMVDPDADTEGNPLNGNTNPNPTDTGSGDTPVVTLPTGQASSLYAIYNPTLAQINSLGAWLWSSDFIDQILKLFSDPMQAIIGLHKIYCTPATGSEQNIKVGYLDSGVSSKVVTNQYTTVNCGSVSLKEYFGNVFDYNPYTQIRLYLPFIGIVPIDTSDAMRGTISVVYHVDVLSGACLAEVKITRDSAGGTIYQYAGNAAVTMPISSGSYIGVIANVVGVASSVVGGFASGGALGAAAGGVTGVLSHRGGTSIQHSGNFSGNAGAMGIKKPYLIIERPQTALANNYADYIGLPSNDTVVLNTCSGYIKLTEIHLENIPATGAELTEIENYLKSGVII